MADAISLIQAGASLAKLASDLVSASDTTKRNAQLIEFQHALIQYGALIASVQQENATLVAQKRDAEEELERMKAWSTEKQRYKLAAPFAGCMVYALQKAMSGGEPAHYLCTACYQKGQRSILQAHEGAPKKNAISYSVFECPACGAEATTPWVNAVAPEYLEDIKPST